MPAATQAVRERPHETGVSLWWLVLLVAALTLGGCAWQKQVNRGEAALEAGNPVSAERYFAAALRLKPELATDRDFTEALHVARRDAALVQAEQRLAARNPLAAITLFEASLDVEPGHRPAADGLTRAKLAAAEMFLADARDKADDGDLAGATERVGKALDQVADHRPSLDAKASLDRPATAGKPAAVEAYVGGLNAISDQRWGDAHAKLRAARAADPNHLPARARLHQVEAVLARWAQAYEDGREQSEARELDAAIASLERAATLRPHEPQTAALLADVKARRAESDGLVAEAEAAKAERRWDDAVAALNDAFALFPNHPEGTALYPRVLDAAAAHFTAIGDEHRVAGRLAEAVDAYNSARRYRLRHTPAVRGLAAVSMSRADSAASLARHGSALLYLLDAEGYYPSNRTSEAIQAARAQLIARAGFRLDLELDDHRAYADEANALHRRLRQQLQRNAPAVVLLPGRGERDDATELAGDGTGAAEAARLARPMYHAELKLTGFVIDLDTVRRENLEHPYTLESEVANPDIPKLRGAIAACESELDGLHHRLRRVHRALDRLACACDPLACSHVHERHRLERRAYDIKREIDVVEGKLRALRRDLAVAPLTITVVEQRRWPFTRTTYRKTGVARGSLSVTGPADVDAVKLAADHKETDSTIDRPNPRVGLDADPLSLTEDAAIEDGLLDEAAIEGSKALLRGVLTAEALRLQKVARGLVDKGDEAAALEYGVDAALLLESVKRDESQRILSTLRERQRGVE